MSDLGLLTMLAVRLGSRGTAAVIAETVVELHAGEGGDRSAHVDRILAAAVDDGRVRRRGEEGRHSLTPAGEAELNALLAADLVGPDRADAATAYEAFLPINRRFLASVVGWQDGLVELETFLELIDEVVPILDSLTGLGLGSVGMHRGWWARSVRLSTTRHGSTPPGSIRSTPSGSNCTSTCSPASAVPAPTSADHRSRRTP